MAVSKTSSKSTGKKKQITIDDIRRRAQEIYEERVKKYLPGDAESDWVKAETELKGS